MKTVLRVNACVSLSHSKCIMEDHLTIPYALFFMFLMDLADCLVQHLVSGRSWYRCIRKKHKKLSIYRMITP